MQDDIRLQKTLTLNAGLRYEMLTVPTEAHGDAVLRNLADQFPVCGVATAVAAAPGRCSQTLRYGILSRASDSHGIRTSGRRLLRGGFGIFDVLPLPYEFTLTFQRVLAFLPNGDRGIISQPDRFQPAPFNN